MERLLGDLTYGVRMLVRYPTLSLGAILTLGVGIGLGTTVFCVVNAGMFKGSVIDRQAWFYRTFGTFFMTFGICALLLAAAGLYGVMSFAVTQRTREMGVRAALGAKGGQLIALVMRRSMVQLAVGVVLGLALASAASGALRPVLYRVDSRDVWVFAGVVLMLITVSLLASLLPARRVAKIDPVTALATE